MTLFQLFLLILSIAIFYMFFKQLFSGEHSKRGVDFEAKTPDARIGGIARPDKTFSRPVVPPLRLEQLLVTADESVEKGDFEEAKKALQSAQIIDKKNTDILHRTGYVMLKTDALHEAKECYEAILEIDADDDMAHGALANILHKQGDDEQAIEHHKRAIALDEEYAPHQFNYANTLYDLKRKEEALGAYQRAYELDDTLEEAQAMIRKLSEKQS